MNEIYKFDERDKHFIKDRPQKSFEHILNMIGARGRLLDFGCGRGELVYAAKSMGLDAVGFDISKNFVEYAGKAYGIEAYHGDIPAGLEKFDFITMVSVIQYLPDPRTTLKQLHALLKSDGTLYIETTNDDALVLKIIRLFKDHYTPHQACAFNKRRLGALLEEVGFKDMRFRIGGLFGGGRTRRFNPVYRLAIFIGGLIGMGHLLFCIAKKKALT